jgi:uncharacterized protein YjbJ (UPF0337 family)
MGNDRINGVVDEMGGKIQDASNGLADYGKRQAKGLSAKTEGSIQDAFGQAKGAVRNISDGASNLAEEAYDRSGRYLRDSSRLVNSQIGDNTLSALLLAGAAGYLLSYIVHSRH